MLKFSEEVLTSFSARSTIFTTANAWKIVVQKVQLYLIGTLEIIANSVDKSNANLHRWTHEKDKFYVHDITIIGYWPYFLLKYKPFWCGLATLLFMHITQILKLMGNFKLRGATFIQINLCCHKSQKTYLLH